MLTESEIVYYAQGFDDGVTETIAAVVEFMEHGGGISASELRGALAMYVAAVKG